MQRIPRMLQHARVFLTGTIWLVALTAACAKPNRDPVQDAASNASVLADAMGADAAVVPVGGGAAGCETTGCDQTCAETVAGLGKTAEYHARFQRGECVLFTYFRTVPSPSPPAPPPPAPPDASPGAVAMQAQPFERPGCRCLSGTPGAPPVELKGRDGVSCVERGRLGQCLLDLTEIAACTPGATSSTCDAACALLETRWSQEFNRSYAATLRSAQCRTDRGDCECVLQIDEQCFASSELNQPYLPWGWSAEHSCALPASGIAAEAAECAKGCSPGRICLFGRCSTPPPGPCTPGSCPTGQTCFQEIKTYCPDCPAAVCIPKAVCETVSPDCQVAP